MSVHYLPDEVLAVIFTFLQLEFHFSTLRLVCNRWNAVVHQPQSHDEYLRIKNPSRWFAQIITKLYCEGPLQGRLRRLTVDLDTDYLPPQQMALCRDSLNFLIRKKFFKQSSCQTGLDWLEFRGAIMQHQVVSILQQLKSPVRSLCLYIPNSDIAFPEILSAGQSINHVDNETGGPLSRLEVLQMTVAWNSMLTIECLNQIGSHLRELLLNGFKIFWPSHHPTVPLSQLRSFSISETSVETITHLFTHGILPQTLRSLAVNASFGRHDDYRSGWLPLLTDEMFASIISQHNLTITNLSLSHLHRVTTSFLIEFVSRLRLEFLELSGLTKIKDEDIGQLVSSLDRLQAFKLSYCPHLTDQSISLIIQNHHDQLKTVTVSHCPLVSRQETVIKNRHNSLISIFVFVSQTDVAVSRIVDTDLYRVEPLDLPCIEDNEGRCLCPRRMCEYCNVFIAACSAQDHYAVCPERPRPCPSFGCPQRFNSTDLSKHLATCPYYVVKCPAPGCTVMTKRSDESYHYFKHHLEPTLYSANLEGISSCWTTAAITSRKSMQRTEYQMRHELATDESPTLMKCPSCSSMVEQNSYFSSHSVPGGSCSQYGTARCRVMFFPSAAMPRPFQPSSLFLWRLQK